MSFYRTQLFSKKEIDTIIENNLIDFNSDTCTCSGTEKEFWPGREVKLCLVEDGVAVWLPGRVINFSGTNEKCVLQVVLHIGQGIYFIINLFDTNTVIFDSEKG